MWSPFRGALPSRDSRGGYRYIDCGKGGFCFIFDLIFEANFRSRPFRLRAAFFVIRIWHGKSLSLLDASRL
jgi:hypothetical protein